MIIGSKTADILFFSIAYFFMARFGLFFSYEQTNASPIWPAAGLGMYVAISYGPIVAISIVIGSLLANLWDFFISGLGLSWKTLVISLAIGLGSYLQALIGILLLRKMTVANSYFSQLYNVLCFMWRVGIACIFAATIGQISVALVFGNSLLCMATGWLMWYVGDYVGVLLTCPLFLMLSSSEFDVRQKFFQCSIVVSSFLGIYLVIHSPVNVPDENLVFRIMAIQVFSGVIGAMSYFMGTQYILGKKIEKKLRKEFEEKIRQERLRLEDFKRKIGEQL